MEEALCMQGCQLALDRASRTCSCTSTAIDAGISVDNVFSVALRNSAYRTFASACAAAYAAVVNYICHGNYLLIK